MSIYLQDIPLQEAQSRLDQALAAANLSGLLGIEDILLDENAVGRVLAEAIWAKISSPNYHAAAMDGYAIRSAETAGATLGNPIVLTCGQGSTKLQAFYVDTGDPLPGWADTVIPIEYVESLSFEGHVSKDIRNPQAIRIREAVAPWHHVRPVGEDIIASQLILPAGHTLRPVDLAAIASGGYSRIPVARRPRVAILPTGSELKPIGEPIEAGQIIEFNSIMLAGQVQQWGGLAVRYPITSDDFENIRNRIITAAKDSDLILINAGSSAGAEDYSAEVINSLGQVYVHGIAVRPGHPVILGMISHGLSGGELSKPVPIIGVPGYPVSTALTAEIFVEPLLSRWLGRPDDEPILMTAILTRKVTSPAGDDDYLRVMLGQVGDRLLATPLPRGAGLISSLMKADGISIIPGGTQGVPAGEKIEVRLYCSLTELTRTILAIGSHDLTLDLLAQFLAPYKRKFVSANVGSLGGLLALKRHEAHLAGSHLLNPASGEYNLSYIHQYLSGNSVIVIMLVKREQGLLVKPGNPKAIHSLVDLSRPDISFINRQRGAGTRVLLDYQLEKMAIPTNRVNGYDQEEYTHLAVAATIASGRADTGLGIAAAAEALGLDFVPLYQEPYHLIIPQEYYESKLLVPLFDILQDLDFHRKVSAMPGYDVSQMGDVVATISAK